MTPGQMINQDCHLAYPVPHKHPAGLADTESPTIEQTDDQNNIQAMNQGFHLQAHIPNATG